MIFKLYWNFVRFYKMNGNQTLVLQNSIQDGEQQ